MKKHDANKDGDDGSNAVMCESHKSYDENFQKHVCDFDGKLHISLARNNTSAVWRYCVRERTISKEI